jgi:hypothetical protein
MGRIVVHLLIRAQVPSAVDRIACGATSPCSSTVLAEVCCDACLRLLAHTTPVELALKEEWRELTRKHNELRDSGALLHTQPRSTLALTLHRRRLQEHTARVREWRHRWRENRKYESLIASSRRQPRLRTNADTQGRRRSAMD